VPARNPDQLLLSFGDVFDVLFCPRLGILVTDLARRQKNIDQSSGEHSDRLKAEALMTEDAEKKNAEIEEVRREETERFGRCQAQRGREAASRGDAGG
jgi:hypothetical protein